MDQNYNSQFYRKKYEDISIHYLMNEWSDMSNGCISPNSNFAICSVVFTPAQQQKRRSSGRDQSVRRESHRFLFAADRFGSLERDADSKDSLVRGLVPCGTSRASQNCAQDSDHRHAGRLRRWHPVDLNDGEPAGALLRTEYIPAH